MIRNENGFTILELTIALALSTAVALVTTMFTFHALRTSDRTGAYLTEVFNVENAGYWLSRDAYMADDVITTNLTAPAIAVLKWTDWGYGTSNTYYLATYSVDNVTDGLGQLNRRLQSSAGADQKVLVARDVYYNADDPASSTNVSYESPVINLKVAVGSGGGEVRNYQIYCRPNF